VADWSPVDLLPGLWVGLLGALLASALRRWFDPIPRRVLAVFALALGVLLGPALFGGGLLLPFDGLRGAVPFQRLPPTDPPANLVQGDLLQLVTPSLGAVRTAWADGRWPLWNRRAGAGLPLLADPQAQALQPLVLLAYPLPLYRAAGVTAALRVLVALVFGFLWMRRQGLGEAPALAGALAFGLGGFLLLWLGWPLANSAALLPLLLYAVVRCDDFCEKSGGSRDFFLLALATWGLLLGGHPETIAYALATALLFLLDRLRRRPRSLRFALARRAAAAMAVAVLAAAPVLFPAADYLPKTLRAARMRQPVAAASLPAVQNAAAKSYLPFVTPNAFGNSRFGEAWGLENTNEEAGGFVGTAMLLAALLALPGLAGRTRFPQERLALGIVIVGLLLIAPVVSGGPGGHALASRRLLLPVAFALAYLGACTLERFARWEVRGWLLLAAVVALGLVIAWGYLAHPDPARPEHLAVFRLGWLRWQLRFLGLAVVLLLGLASPPLRGDDGRRSRNFMVAGVAVVIAAELLLLHRPANPAMPRGVALPENGPLEFIRQQIGKSPPRGPGFRIAALGADLPPNVAALYGLTDARIYNPMAPRAYVERIAPILAGWRGESPELGSPDHPLYARLGVRYLVAAPNAELPPPFARVFFNLEGSVWEQPAARPRLFLEGKRSSQISGRVLIRRFDDERIQAEVRVRRPQWLASILYQDGGWRVLRNGFPWPSEVDQGIFLGVPLLPGAARLDVLYRPAAFLWGCALAALGLALGVALLAPRPLTSPAGPPPPAEP
jgi:hypothetical protein